MSTTETTHTTDLDESGAVDTPQNQSAKTKTFAETATAAKLSGTYNIAAGKIKSKIAEYTDNPDLKKEGRDQELLGKIHRLVGAVRGVREATLHQVMFKTKETQKICLKHGGRLIDVATDFIEDLKKTLLK